MNKPITEDYVSYEIAVLLKEKGFDIPCDSYYTYFESNVTLYKGYLPEFSDSNINHNKHNDRISRPSQSLALKWLREEQNLYIEIRRNLNTFYYGWKVEQGMSEKAIFDYKYDTYEEAVEAALKFTLENLI